MNLPEDFIERMQSLLGEEYEAFRQSYDKEPRKALRVNTLKIGVGDFTSLSPFCVSKVPWCDTGFYYDGAVESPGKHPYHEIGLYYIQEPSAMSTGRLADVKPGEYVLDLCGAPGGKSTQLAAALQGEGLLISNEIHPVRCKILSQNIERMGITNAVVTNETPANLAKHFMNFFDCIVVDAPCSGEGMFRKDETAIKEWSLENVELCASRQDDILDEAVKMLRSGGRIAYSTCTFAPAEDEDCIRRFLERHPDFEVIKGNSHEAFSNGVAAWGKEALGIEKTHRLWPHKLEGEGHFAALLQHKGERLVRAGRAKQTNAGLDKEKQQLYDEFVKEVLTEEPMGEMLLFGDALYLMPVELNLKGLKVLRPGLHVGTFEKKRFEPSHSLALALKGTQVKQVCDLSTTTDLPEKYLRGESFAAEAYKGWTLISIDGYSAGWGKASNGMMKNHYPKGLRK